MLLLAGFAWALWLLIVPGYLLSIARPRAARRPPRTARPTDLPAVDVVVPVHDEARFIGDKLRNLAALDYPADRLRVWIVDGASTDETTELVAAHAACDRRFELLTLARGDKIAQLNAALHRCDAPWVLVTDADAHLAPDTLRRLVSEGESDANLFVVGTSVRPSRAHVLERVHWRFTNWVRQRESAWGSSSFVVGPWYLFRRRLLERFPVDVVADDIFVALSALAAGWRVGFQDALVTEMRSPLSIGELFRHKVRKSDAYLRELFRFLPRAGGMAPRARAMVRLRAAHMILAPLLFGGATAAVVVGPGSVATAFVATGLVAVAAVAVGHARQLAVAPALIALGVFLTTALCVALVTYPFAQRTACYPRLRVRTRVARTASTEGTDAE